MEIKQVGIIGLGLMGGSMAKAIKAKTDCRVLGYDINESITKKAILINSIDDELKKNNIGYCDLIIIALFPKDIVKFVQTHAKDIKKGALVVDCGGVKRVVCEAVEPIAKEQGFIFIGGHPMAGLAHKGFEYSKSDMYKGASMVLVPPHGTPIASVEKIKKFFTNLGFTNTQIASAQEHDRMIAFTSQLAHIVSNAYVKSPTAENHHGFSAGSYKDLTRVAELNEVMWAELFLENSDNILNEIDCIIEKLLDYRNAINNNDELALREMLRFGRVRKQNIDNTSL